MAGARARRFVSRGGDKLDAALDAFGIDVNGMRALDAGASTGGFTDCLLARGAREVVSVDVAYGQFAWSLRNDPRVTVLERTNIRMLDPARAGGHADVVVADLAFISLASVAGTLAELCTPAGDLVVLVKPQFELPRDAVERGGVVRIKQGWMDAMMRVAESFAAVGFAVAGATPSPLVGPKGNREFFLHLSRARPAAAGDAIARAAEAAP